MTGDLAISHTLRPGRSIGINNLNAEPTELIIIENSTLLEALGLHERESFGLISYADYLGTQKEA